MWKSLKVIDADGHMHEPLDLWTRNIEAKCRDQMPKVAFMDGNIMVYEPDGKFIKKGEIQAVPPASARRAMDSDERMLGHVVEYLSGENLVWNTDYPHANALEPAEALPLFDAQIASADSKRKILWDNAVKLFGPRIVA